MKKTTNTKNTKNYIKYQVYDAVVYPIKLVVAMTDGDSDETSELNDVFTPKTDISINGNDAITFPAVLIWISLSSPSANTLEPEDTSYSEITAQNA